METYLTPGNQGFSGIRNDIYVDKSGLIRLVNDTIETPRRLTCVSRPRRFGKSFAAQMLCAYYDKTCDSSRLFEDLEIAADGMKSYNKYRNKFDVIYLALRITSHRPLRTPINVPACSQRPIGTPQALL